MNQAINILIVVMATIVGFVYFKVKDKSTNNIYKILFCLGLLCSSLGSLIVFILHGYSFVVDSLLLRNIHSSGYFILIGYSLISLSFIICISIIFDKINEFLIKK
jgi:hypothetical protein